LTREGPEAFVPKLEDLCASAGVAVVFVPELPKIGIWGATRWLGDKAVIQLSLRYKSNDHLWFTFFHEAGHILKHGRKEIFIEGKGLNGEKEEEANAYARDKLIPPAQMRRLIKSGRPTLATVERFADEIGIAPGIVVGRLQHEKVLPMGIRATSSRCSTAGKVRTPNESAGIEARLEDGQVRRHRPERCCAGGSG
jgi:HTH-type transcriptional regulator / antitoxin HigA